MWGLGDNFGPYGSQLRGAIDPQMLVIDSLRLKIDSHRHKIFRQNGEIAYYSNERSTKICDFDEITKHVDYGAVWGETGVSGFVKHDCLFTFLKESKCLPRRI